MFRRLLLPFAVAAMLAGPIADARADGPTLHFRLGEDPETLYNVKSFSLTVSSVLGPYLLDRLVYFDASGQPKPWLAESWTVSEDQKEITFKLRTGIKFTDGTDFNAAAAKAQFDAVMDKKNVSPLLPLLGSLQSVEAPDATTLRFTFAKPFAPFLSNIAQASFGFNSPAAVAKYGGQYGRHVVGTGPYMLKSWDPGSEIVLVRNPNYHQYRGDAVNKGAPIADRIVLTVISEEGVAQAALEDQELTAAAVSADAIDALAKNPAFTTVINKVVTNLYFLEFNENRAPFNDPNVRRAIGYAIDRDAVVKAAFNGYASPALGPLASGIPGYDASIGQQYGTPYNPAKAKALMEAAGWTPRADGVLMKDGKPAQFVIKSYSGFVTIDRTLSVIQSNLADIGIKVSLQTSDWGTFYPSLLNNDWDMDLMRWTNADPSILSVLFRSPGHRKATLANPTADAVLDRCDALMDSNVRMDCVHEAQKDLVDAATIVPVTSSWAVTITQADVKDYTIDYFNNLIPGDVRIVK